MRLGEIFALSFPGRFAGAFFTCPGPYVSAGPAGPVPAAVRRYYPGAELRLRLYSLWHHYADHAQWDGTFSFHAALGYGNRNHRVAGAYARRDRCGAGGGSPGGCRGALSGHAAQPAGRSLSDRHLIRSSAGGGHRLRSALRYALWRVLSAHSSAGLPGGDGDGAARVQYCAQRRSYARRHPAAGRRGRQRRARSFPDAHFGIQALFTWLSGGIAVTSWPPVLIVGIIIIAGIIISLGFAGVLDTFALGEEGAEHLGLHVERYKFVIVIVASLITAAAVSISGLIGFVGLVTPHMMRLMLGPKHRALLPASALGGAIFLTLADLLARVVIAPAVLPVGVFTALVGAPFFLLLLRNSRRNYRW